MYKKNISIRDFLHVIFKRKELIAGIFCLSLTCTIMGTLLMTPKYRATSKVLINDGREYLNLSTRKDFRQFFPGGAIQQLNSELELVRSRSLAEKVINQVGRSTIFQDRPGIKSLLKSWIAGNSERQKKDEEAIDEFKSALYVSPLPNSNVIEISFAHWNPKISARVTNALVDLYIDHHLKVHIPAQAYAFYDEQSGVLKKKLDHSEKALEIFKAEKGLSALNEERTLLLKQSAEVESASKLANRHLVETKDRNKKLSEHLATTPKKVTERNERDPNLSLISSLQEKLVNLEVEKNARLKKYTSQSRHVKNVDDEIKLVRAKLSKYAKISYNRSSTGINPTYSRLNDQLLDGQTELQALLSRQEILSVQLEEYRDRLKELNEIEAKFNGLYKEVLLNRKNYYLYKEKVEQSRISKAMDVEKIANVSIIELAKPPLKQVSPKVLLNLLIGVACGGLLGVSVAFFLEYFNDHIETVEDVEEILKVPVLTSISNETLYEM